MIAFRSKLPPVTHYLIRLKDKERVQRVNKDMNGPFEVVSWSQRTISGSDGVVLETFDTFCVLPPRRR